MKSSFIKSLLTIVLLISCVICGTACTKEGPTDDTKADTSADVTANEEETEESSPTLSNASSVGSSATAGGMNFYLKLDGIEGESKDSAHSHWIDVIDYSDGIAHENQTNVMAGTGEIALTPIVFTHKVDRATPKIQENCVKGRTIRTGELQATKSVSGQQTTIVKIEFSSLSIVDATVKTVVKEDGSSYLVEEVTMIAGNETCTVTADQGSVGTSGGGLTYYAKFDGIEGESRDSRHLRWIDATGFSHGSVLDTESKTGEFQTVVLTHKVDVSTQGFRTRCLNGQTVRTAEFNAVKSVAGRDTVIYKVALEGIKIVKCTLRTVTDENGALYLVEDVTMLVDKETWTYADAGIDDSGSGKTEAGYDQTRRA